MSDFSPTEELSNETGLLRVPAILTQVKWERARPAFSRAKSHQTRINLNVIDLYKGTRSEKVRSREVTTSHPIKWLKNARRKEQTWNMEGYQCFCWWLLHTLTRRFFSPHNARHVTEVLGSQARRKKILPGFVSRNEPSGYCIESFGYVYPTVMPLLRTLWSLPVFSGYKGTLRPILS